MINKLYETIFPLLRSALWGEEKYPFMGRADVDWEAVYEELKLQAIQHLPLDILVCVNGNMRGVYLKAAGRAISSWHKLMTEQHKLCELFETEGIPFAILKGTAVDCYYPKPMYRCMGDVDIIVKPEDFERAHAVMLRKGYEEIADCPRHAELKKAGVLFELHRYYAIFNDPVCANLLDRQIFEALDRTDKAYIEGISFSVLPVSMNGLVLLEHINQHLEMGLGLRQIIDWMLYVDRELDDERWYGEFEKFTAQISMRTLAVTVTKMCQKYLGLREDITWCMEADDELCEELMEYIVRQGNMGRKFSSLSNCIVCAVDCCNNFIGMFKMLQQRGCENWKVLKKYSCLKPFAWLYQIFRYIRRIVLSKYSFKKFKRDISISHKDNDLMSRLGVRQRSNSWH